ncbi:hypothetical protein CCYA_CCYA01G0024 [Cyanidiococcus yangmingshanensis]|nr:hypothetical protein CCYA_CCYA01G0024 [Cyanidiococcus yangmingshanensis]
MSKTASEERLPFLLHPPTQADVLELAEYAQSAAVLYGLVMAASASSSSGSGQAPTWTAMPVPMTLFPTVVPRSCYHQARSLMVPLQRCMDSLARDTPFLLQCLRVTATQDPFTARLCELARQNPMEDDRPALGILRADYFITTDRRLRLVEINTIASSFGALGSHLRSLHTHVLHRADILGLFRDLPHRAHSDLPGHIDAAVAQLASWRRAQCENNMPENGALEGIAEALAHAHRWWRAQQESQSLDVDTAVVLFVTQPGERNIYDQKWVEFTLWKEHSIRVRRATLSQIAEHGQLVTTGSGTRPALTLAMGAAGDPRAEFVSVVYYRAGYIPQDYPSDREWEARAMIARSSAIECPTVAYQLVGSKRMQQILGEPGVFERYLSDSPDSKWHAQDAASTQLEERAHSKAEAVLETFVGMYAFDDPSNRAAIVQRVLDHPDEFVLKPQREGGGNNLYGADMVKCIEAYWNAPEMVPRRQDPEHPLCAYVLMDRIHPASSENVILRNGNAPVRSECVSELGIFGIFFGNARHRGSASTSTIIDTLNQAVGHLLRTKAARQDDGGVAAGVAALDSPWLDTV